MASVEGYGDENKVLSVHGPRHFLGELGLITGQSTLVSAVVQRPGEVLAAPLTNSVRSWRATPPWAT